MIKIPKFKIPKIPTIPKSPTINTPKIGRLTNLKVKWTPPKTEFTKSGSKFTSGIFKMWFKRK